LAVIAAVTVVARPAAAQFSKSYTDIGPVIGLGSIGDAGIAFGGRFEKGIKDLPSLGNGTLGIQVGATYYSWSSFGYSVSYIPIGVTANYHFKTSNDKFDPFLGLGLGYEVVSCDIPGAGSCGAYDSAIFFVGRVGARYFWKPKMALYADVGAGGASLNVGLMFKLK
jgi:hypothetical protein